MVKICGNNDAAGLRAAIVGGADAVGFVFFPPSPRAVTPAKVNALWQEAEILDPSLRTLAQRPRRVGLFVNPTEDEIAAVMDAMQLDTLQLYGTTPPFDALRRRYDVRLWRAVGVAAKADLPTHALEADALLIEAKAPKHATRPGGNALRFDWSLLQGWRPPCPWWLGGGLRPGNVTEAIGISGATAVDVSSGVESAPGRKDPELIRQFIAAARQAA